MPDFKLVPDQVIKEELVRKGIRGGTIRKGVMYQLIEVVWKYVKLGDVPWAYRTEPDEQEEDEQQ